MEDFLKSLCFSAKRALRGQMPKTLRAYSFAINSEEGLILLRAHFERPPSEDDLEDISVIEAEIDADFIDDFEVRTEIEVVAPGKSPSLLSGGVAYLGQGETGTTCSE